ncbi:MAG: hypothetical protein ACQESF_00980 [Nanobdellota archaeon]
MEAKRGQTATEYLIILAVVIVIALVVVVAMGKFPGIGQTTASKATQAYWGAQDIGVDSYAMTTGPDVMYLKNNNRNTVEVTNITVDGTTVDFSKTLGPGEQAEFELGDDAACVGAEQGDTFSVNLAIEYRDVKTNTSYTVDGDGNTFDGECGGY